MSFSSQPEQRNQTQSQYYATICSTVLWCIAVWFGRVGHLCFFASPILPFLLLLRKSPSSANQLTWEPSLCKGKWPRVSPFGFGRCQG